MHSDEGLRLVFPATLADAREVTELVTRLCGRMSADERALYATAVMELLVNVVKHGYGNAADATITISAVPGPDAIELIIEDTGIGMPAGRFDAAPAEVDFDAGDLSRLPEAGLGLAIVKSVMDTVQYRHDRGGNRLTAMRRWVR